MALLLLRLCTLPCMGYLLQVTPPPIIRKHATFFDETILQTAVNKLGLPHMLPEQAKLTLQLPIKLGGFGLRSAERTSHPAYYSSVSMLAKEIAQRVPAADRNELLVEVKTRIQMANNIADCMQHFTDAGLHGAGIYTTDLSTFWGGPEDETKLQGAIVGLSEKSFHKISGKPCRKHKCSDC